MTTPEIHSSLPPALRAHITRDVRRIANESLAAGFAIGALLSSAFWLWLTWK
jgi:hypothetical protein